MIIETISTNYHFFCSLDSFDIYTDLFAITFSDIVSAKYGIIVIIVIIVAILSFGRSTTCFGYSRD